ncbi:MAG TPA: hypothetical protein VIA18_08500, partial [Polyangia bacterium]|nr:hypothetical protein [Polyangia bacterium]
KEDKVAYATAQQHVAYLLDRALQDGLMTPRDIVDGIGVAELCNRLPRSEMAALFTAALDGGRKGTPFTDKDLLATLPPSTLVQHVPLTHIYETVIHARVAAVHAYLAAEEKPVEPSPPAPPPAPSEPKSAAADSPEAAPALEVRADEPHANGANGTRKSKRPPAEGSGEQQTTVEEDPEWIDIPESKR